MLVACGMADENSKMDNGYAQYVKRCSSIGAKAMSEFDWINKFVVSSLKFNLSNVEETYGRYGSGV